MQEEGKGGTDREPDKQKFKGSEIKEKIESCRPFPRQEARLPPMRNQKKQPLSPSARGGAKKASLVIQERRASGNKRGKTLLQQSPEKQKGARPSSWKRRKEKPPSEYREKAKLDLQGPGKEYNSPEKYRPKKS